MRRHRVRRWWLLAVPAVIVVALAWLYQRARSVPDWYAPVDAGDVEVVELAESVEYGVTEAFHRIRPAEERWSLTIREGQLNAWLAARLPEWIAHQPDLAWPAEIGVPQIHVDAEGLRLAVEVRGGRSAQVLVTRIVPELVDGQLRVQIASVGAGRLSVPGQAAGTVLDVIERIAPGGLPEGGLVEESAARRLLAMLSEDQAMASRFTLGDGRRVELVGLELGDGAIRLTSRTLPTEPD